MADLCVLLSPERPPRSAESGLVGAGPAKSDRVAGIVAGLLTTRRIGDKILTIKTVTITVIEVWNSFPNSVTSTNILGRWRI
jgi:hypothetical protein